MFQNILHDPSTQIFFLVPLALIALDTVVAVLGALKRKEFSTSYLAGFAQANLPGYLSLLVVSLLIPLASGVPYAAAAGAAKVGMGAFCVSQLHSIYTNLCYLLGKPAWADLVDNWINGLVGKVFPAATVSPVAPVTPTPLASAETTTTDPNKAA